MRLTRPATIFLCAVTVLLGARQASADKLNTLGINTVKGKEYVSLYDVSAVFGLESTFDVITQKGKLYKGEHFAIFQPGFSVVLADNRIVKSQYPVLRNTDGDIYIPTELFEEIISMLRSDVQVTRSGAAYRIGVRSSVAVSKKPVSRIERDEHIEKISFIVIDAGHGGKDPGALGKGGSREKDVVLNTALQLKKYLDSRLKGVNVRLSRGRDTFLELGQRTEIANRMLKKNANGLFISIHANAALSPRTSGYETYFLSQNPTNEDARITSALENNVVVFESKKGKQPDDVEFVEALMMTTQIQKESGILADYVQRNMEAKLRYFPSRGVKKADFFVLRGSLMPAVLVEIGYMTSKEECAMLKKDGYRKEIAQAVGNGVIRFVKEYNRIVKK